MATRKTGIPSRPLFLFFLAAGHVLNWGCAPSMPPPGQGEQSSYEKLASEKTDSESFEVPAQHLDPASVLAPAMVQGPGYEVKDIRYGAGLLYFYSIQTAAGTVEARGQGMLRKRIHEIETLAALKDAGVQNRDVYALALANAAEAPAEGGMQLLLHPVRTTTNIPKGMWSMARNYYEMTEAGRTYLEDDYFHELIGFGKAKREWSYRLGLDPYTANPQVQADLDRLAWLSLAGGMSVRLPLMAVPGGASIALTVTNTSDDMKRELRDDTPEDIRIRSREILLNDFDVDEVVSAQFVYHPWYSPSQQLEIVDALAAMGDVSNREAFISLANLADTPSEAYAFSRLALIFLGFHERLGPVEEFWAAEGVALARNSKAEIALAFNIDFGFWTEGAAQLIGEIDDAISKEGKTSPRYMLISGNLSPRALAEAESRGWTVIQDLESSWLEEFDAKAFAPGDPDDQRILPEFGS